MTHYLRHIIAIAATIASQQMSAQFAIEAVKEKPATKVKTIPIAQYSGITHIEGNTFALVDNGSRKCGFYLMDIELNAKGKVSNVQSKGFFGETTGTMDYEGIAYNPQQKTLFVSQEADHKIREMNLDGTLTGREITLPDSIGNAMTFNRSLEALCYDSESGLLWTGTESTLSLDGEATTDTNGKPSICRLFAFDNSLRQEKWIRYQTDTPVYTKKTPKFAFGVSAITAVGKNQLLVLEREARAWTSIPTALKSKVINKVYLINVADLKDGEYAEKTKVLEFSTPLRSWANYEGMTITPRDENGEYTLIMISDSENRYKKSAGIFKFSLKDRFKSVKLRIHD